MIPASGNGNAYLKSPCLNARVERLCGLYPHPLLEELLA